MSKIESESARKAREARVQAAKEAQREAQREADRVSYEIEQARANDHIGRERAATAAKLARQGHSTCISHENPFASAQCFVIEVTGPTPGVCCMCGGDPNYTKQPTWSILGAGGIKRSHCRACLYGQFGRTPSDINTNTGGFKR